MCLFVMWLWYAVLYHINHLRLTVCLQTNTQTRRKQNNIQHNHCQMNGYGQSLKDVKNHTMNEGQTWGLHPMYWIQESRIHWVMEDSLFDNILNILPEVWYQRIRHKQLQWLAFLYISIMVSENKRILASFPIWQSSKNACLSCQCSER